MKNQFKVEIENFSNIKQIAGAVTTDDYRALLDLMEYGDTSALTDTELDEMCILSLQDCEPEVAASYALTHFLGSDLKPGQIQHLANEMQDEKLWEEYSDLGLHEKFFNVGSILYSAHQKVFPVPDAVKLQARVTSLDRALDRQHLDESFTVRMLADGMPKNAVLIRLFDEQIYGKRFELADKIIWIMNLGAVTDRSVEIEIISSGYWLDPLSEIKSYQSGAYSDKDTR